MENNLDYTMSYSMSETQRLELQITRDEERWRNITNTLKGMSLLERSRKTDDLLDERNNINFRIEANRTRLALLKSSSELTEEEKKRRPGPGGSERFNIKY